ncbi:hypothetical protein [Rhizobium tumorigenes]|uniref:hypothetical protein n=1 Tax=Rhizobium tumorigenes TaxID=2041385 RepID=UPI00241D3E7F|nr:hypothetical protein [Rhizobium tumorigenes]WFR99608.1 hypothetical protein PR016_10565 [Rhizobium tumorigenes]
MFLSQSYEQWRLLTPLNIRTRKLWGWGHSIQKFVSVGEPQPRASDELLIVSDYGGDHPRSTHHIYCYLVIRKIRPELFARLKAIRNSLLDNGRTMSYKRLDDAQRQAALIPFLGAAADIDGHVVAIAVDKRRKWLSTIPDVANDFQKALNLNTFWKPKPLEAMIRKVHFTAIILSLWSRPYTNVTWVTDQDEFVANDSRHDDAIKALERISSFYLSHPMGIFRLNTTGQYPKVGGYEDVCAIPDLAAGMLSEISTQLNKGGRWEETIRRDIGANIPIKAGIIANWFWDEDMMLRKTFISIDTENSNFSVRKISMT